MSLTVAVEPNHVYVIPPNRDVRILNGSLWLTPRSKVRGWPNVISIFLKLLADEQKENGTAVILSGYGHDGSDALAGVKAMDGITFAQTSGSAEVSEMPRHGVETGHIDYVLSPEEIAFKLVEIASHAFEADLLGYAQASNAPFTYAEEQLDRWKRRLFEADVCRS